MERALAFDYMSARRVDPDIEGWPKFSACTASDIAGLMPQATERTLRAIGYQGTATRHEALGSTGPNRNQFVAMFAPESRTAEMGFYVLTRVVPTLLSAGILRG